MTNILVKLTLCRLWGHDWRPDSPMFSDGWRSKCARCGTIRNVDR